MNYWSSKNFFFICSACLTLLLVCSSFPRTARAQKRIAIMDISGPQSGEITRQLMRALQSRYEVIGGGRLGQAARKQKTSLYSAEGKSIAARSLSVAGIVNGTISLVAGRWVLKLSVLSGHSGRPVGSAVIPLRGPRLDPTTANRIPSILASALSQARSGPPLSAGTSVTVKTAPSKTTPPSGGQKKKPQDKEESAAETDLIIPEPPPEKSSATKAPKEEPSAPTEPTPPANEASEKKPTQSSSPAKPQSEEDAVPEIRSTPSSAPPTNESLGFEVNQNAAGKENVAQYKPASGEGPNEPNTEEEEEQSPNNSVLEIGLGLQILNRNFSFNDPVNPTNPPNYNAGSIKVFQVQGSIFPLAAGHRGPLANLGLTGSYFRAVALKSQLENSAEPIETNLDGFEVGLRYRWQIMNSPMSPVYNGGVEFGQQNFSINPPPQDLPNLSYNFLKLALASLDVPFYRNSKMLLGLNIGFNYMLIFSAGDIERTDSSGYGSSSVAGVDGRAGLFAIFNDFFIRAGFMYRRIFFDFDNLCANNTLGCNTAGGALDILLGGSFLLGFTY